MPFRIFITGANGYLGRAITERLVRGGHEVLGLARSAEAVRSVESLGARAVPGDLEDSSGWIGALQNCDAAVHTAGVGPDAAALDQTVLEAIGAAAQDGRIRRLLYTSSVWDYGDTGDGIADESWPLDPPADRTWRPAHHEAAFALADHDVTAVVLQPAILYGGWQGIVGEMFAEAHESGTVSYPGDGTQHWPLVHRDDAAEGYALALEHAARGSRILLADGSDLTAKEIAESIARETGATAAPATIERLRAGLAGLGEGLLLNQRVSAARARRELGWVPRHASLAAEIADLHRDWQRSLTTSA